MKIIVCYKNYLLGELEKNDNCYIYISLKDIDKFKDQYNFIDFELINVKNKTYKKLPYFFTEFVDRLIFNPLISNKLNIDLKRDSYFDILYRYSKLPQDKNSFYFIAK